MNSRQRALAAIAGQAVDRVPVFPLLMFFAAQRAGISYREFATNGAALAQAQLKVRERFGIDAITACSDAYRICADLGAEMDYPLEAPPRAQRPLIGGSHDIARLGRPDPQARGSRMRDRIAGVEEMARAAGGECLVLGWVDMPFAEACSLCGLSEFMLLLANEPTLAHAVLEFVTPIVIDFACAQVAAGAEMIGAGDAAASLISARMYREFALPYEQRVSAAVHAANGLVKLHICGNTSALLNDMAHSGCDLFNVDHLVDFEKARAAYGAAGKCFKGNLNPVADLMQTTPEACRAQCRERVAAAKGAAYMLSAGCEIPAGVSDAVFEAFCSAVMPS
jgi:uroporphyrinogen decarboxylase